MANKSKSKVKSYARRTKKGISRVTGHNRDNKNKRNRNIAIGLGIGTSVLALGLGAKHLAKKKGLSKPKIEVDQIKSPYTNRAPNSNTTKVGFDEVIDTEFGKDNPFVRPDKPKVSDEPVFGQTRKMTTQNKQLDRLKTYEPSVKRRANSERVLARKQELMVDATYDAKADSFSQTFFLADKSNPNRLQRKQAAKKLAEIAETPSAPVAEVRQTTQAVVDKAKEIKANKPKVTVDSKELETLKEINEALNSGEVGKDSIGILRQEKREIADRIRGKSKPKTNKFLDQALTGQGYQPKPKPKATVVDERIARIERQQKWDTKRGVVLRRKKLLEESLGKKVVDKTKGRLDFNPTPKSRKARKKAAKQVAAEAKRLRGLGEYY
jgi:hypothetical protein